MKWISCDFRMPKNGKDVLVYVPEVGILVGKYEKDGYWTVYGTYGSTDVTYWQPLPHEPKEKKLTEYDSPFCNEIEK